MKKTQTKVCEVIFWNLANSHLTWTFPGLANRKKIILRRSRTESGSICAVSDSKTRKKKALAQKRRLR